MTHSSWWRLRWIPLASFGLLSPWFWLTFPVCVWLGAASLLWLARRASGEGRLRWIILGSFGLRALLGTLLYTASYYHWPILRSLQVQGGFWAFGMDSHLYHAFGAQIAEAWTHGIEPADSGIRLEYFAIIAAVYWLLDAHPLYAVLLNCWLGALTGWLAYRIGERLFDSRIAVRAALLVGFWPSSVLWSSQILRDALTWALILTVLWLVARMVGPDLAATATTRQGGPARLWRWAAHAAGVVAATLLLTRLRVYLGSVLSVAALVTLVPAGCAALLNRRLVAAVRRFFSRIRHDVARAAGLGSVAALVIGVVLVARDLDTTRLFWPAHPERGHIRLGLQHRHRGDLALAEAEFRRAIDVRPDDPQAYLLWAGMLSAAHRPREALAVCASWSGADPDGAMRRCVNQLSASFEAPKVVGSDSPRMPPQHERASAPALPPTPPPTPITIAPTPVAVPAVPTNLQTRALSDTQIALSWTASTGNVAAAGYRIFRDGVLIGTSLGLSYQDLWLSPETAYAYAIAAVDAAGNASAQTPVVTATSRPPGLASEPPPTGLLAHWSLDEGDGPIAAEASNQPPHVWLHNGPRWIRGVLGKALSFDGVDDYVDAGPIPPLTANFTIAGWVYRRPEIPPRGRAMWCSQGVDGVNGWAVLMQESAGRIVHAFLKGGVALVTSGVPSAKSWEHVAWVVDAHARPTLYLNGTLVAQGSHDLPILPPAPGIFTYLGADQVSLATPGRFFPGALDDVRLYRRALTAEEIAELIRGQVTAAKLPRLVSKRRARRKQTSPNAPPEVAPVPVIQRVEAVPPPPPNPPPEVKIGPPQTVRRPQTVVLTGWVDDDGRPDNILTYQWTQLLGPPALLVSPTAIETRVQLTERARYQFRLSASDGALSTFDDVSVTVEALSVGTIADHLGAQGLAIISEMNPQWLGALRGSVVFAGGNSLMDAQSDVSHPRALVSYLPRAILVGFLAPFPWQWFETGGSTGGMRVFAGAEVALIYLLLIGLTLRAWRTIRLFGVRGCVRRTIRQMPLGGRFILVFSVVLGAAAGLVTANLGTLFRIRLLYWLPLLILVAAGQCSGAWYRRRFIRGRDRWRAWPRDEGMAPVPEPPAEASLVTAGASGEQD